MRLQRRQVLLGAALALAPKFAVAQAGARLPFVLLNGKMFLAVEINGQKAQAMVDSGAQFSAISQDFAEQHNIPTHGRVPFRGIQGAGVARRADNVRLNFGGAAAVAGQVIALDLSRLAEDVEHEIDAVIGGDVFRAYVIDIDFDSMTLAFFDRAKFAAPAGAKLVPLTPFRDLMTVQVQVENGTPIQALVDLGSNVPLIISPGPAKKIGLLNGRKTSTRLMGGHGAQSTAKVTTAKTISIGGERFADVPVMIPPKSIGLDANLGLTVLWRFRLYLDYGGQRLWLGAPTGDRNEPFQRDYVGLESRYQGDNLKVVAVSPGSPAQAAGFRPGEVITAINGAPVREVNTGLGVTEKPGDVLKLTLSTGEVRQLTLAVYY